ncbi:MAG: M20/M25/M40 family metallo-hydrolase [Chitinophagaceae bacterium]|nr:M20/M25/M40 family metallo-hydrolase [Chitinophagaceae bacterium]
MKKLSLLLLLCPVLVNAQYRDDSVTIKKISDEILRNGKAYDLLYQLTKQVGGRLAGSPQFAKAISWGKDAMEKNGADQVFLQQCMVPHWSRGGADKAVIISVDGKKTSRNLDVLALGNSLGSGTVSAEVLAVADFDELERRKDEVKGKIVYYNAGFNPANVSPFKSYGETGIYRRSGPSRAARYGALGVMIRSLTESTANNPHTGAMQYNDSFPKIPAIAVGPRDADEVWELSKKAHFTMSMTTNGHFLPDTVGYNVVAELRGTEFPDQYITVGGHLDSWDVNEGAHDDGTGVVHTIEIMRALKAIGYRPKHTIRFVLFANEENGLRGGIKYAEEAKAKNEKHLFALESDAGGFTPRGFSLGVSAAQLAKFRSWLPLLSPYGTASFTEDGGGADVGPLQRQLGAAVGELNPDQQRYFDVHHARSDVFENVNKRELLLGAVNMAALIYLVDKYGL